MPERKYHRKNYQKSQRELSSILKISFFCLLFFVFSFLSLFFYYAKDLPRPERFFERQLFESTKIYDRSGQVVLYEIYGEEKRTWVSLEKVPEYLKKAMIATEDANFYHHSGIDFRGIINAIRANLKIMKPIYGGSTIPQQLIRSTFLSLEKTVERKTREIILSLELDRRYSKEQILEWYLNQIPFGRNAYGVEAASQAYFKKSVWEISLPEAATLAALIKAPSFYSTNLDELLIRKDYVLNRMANEKFLSAEESKAAKKEEVDIVNFSQSILAPHFTLWVKRQLEERYGRRFLEQKGLKIFTSLDWELQQFAEEMVKEGVKNNKIYNSRNAALVAISPKSGEILALVGSADYFGQPFPKDCRPGLNCQFDPQFNAAVGTKNLPGRQPGSAFKPFVYVTAFKKGYNDEVIVVDELTNFGIWGGKAYIPQNYDGKFRGPVTLREALAQSINVPSVKVLLYLVDSEEKFRKVGEKPDSIKTAKDLGISTLNPPYGPSIVLGGWEVKLLEMVSAYGVFATEGLRAEPTNILRIEDSIGNIIEENKKTPKRVLEKEPVRLINDILSDNKARAPMFGWKSPLYFENCQVAVKTGTTQNYRDAWTIGYTPSLVAGVWVGNNDNSPMARKSGVTLAAPIWRAFLKKALLKYPPENFSPSPK